MPKLPPSLPAVPCLLGFALPLLAGPVPGDDGKGADLRPIFREDSLLREEAMRRQELGAQLNRRMLAAMRLNEYGDECVAYDPAAAGCILTVDAFNRALNGRAFPVRETDPDFPSRAEVDAARGAVLGELLRDRFLAGVTLPAAVRDSLTAAADARWTGQMRAARSRLGDSALYAAYRAHADLFRGGEERSYQALAGSDSARIDSLWRDPATRSLASAGPSHRIPAGSPWTALRSEDVPPEARRAADSLAPGAVSPPIRTPYGFVAIGLVSRRAIPDTTFEKAIPTLIALAAARPKDESASRERDWADYFQSHRDRLFLPDTVRFRAWLLPGNRPMRLSQRLERERMRADTSGYRPSEVGEQDLPPRLRQELAYYRPFRNGEILGPIRSVFGTWYLRVQSVRKGRPCRTPAEAMPVMTAARYGERGAPARGASASLAEFQAKQGEARRAPIAGFFRERDPEAFDRWLRGQLTLRFVEPPAPAVGVARGTVP